MTCNDAREALLTADVEELTGASDTPFAEHLRECEDCRALADEMSRELDGLSRLLDTRTAFVRRVRRVTLLAGAAAAVVVIGLLLPDAMRSPAPAIVETTAATTVSVDVRPGQRAAVIATKDPKVTIVWIVQGGGH